MPMQPLPWPIAGAEPQSGPTARRLGRALTGRAWAWALVPALVLHAGAWWQWRHAGLAGAGHDEAAPLTAKAVAVRVRVVERATDAAPARQAPPPAVPAIQDAVWTGPAAAVDAQADHVADRMPHRLHQEAGRVAAHEVPAASQDLRVQESEASEETEGEHALRAVYWPSEQLSQSPRPEMGWMLDEDALARVRWGRLVVQVWVSAQGRIDHVALLRAEPAESDAGGWAKQALRHLADTPMLAGVKDGEPVPATLVVEISSENERFR